MLLTHVEVFLLQFLVDSSIGDSTPTDATEEYYDTANTNNKLCEY